MAFSEQHATLGELLPTADTQSPRWYGPASPWERRLNAGLTRPSTDITNTEVGCEELPLTSQSSMVWGGSARSPASGIRQTEARSPGPPLLRSYATWSK